MRKPRSVAAFAARRRRRRRFATGTAAISPAGFPSTAGRLITFGYLLRLLQASAARLIAAALLTLQAWAATPPAPASAAECTFVLGFATLRDLAGPEVVGDCLEGQRTTEDGAEQRTSRGLLAWRKADNATAFTDGYRTWLNGPHGLQVRLNAEQFEWETAITVAAPEGTERLVAAAAGDETLSLDALARLYVEATRTGNTERLRQVYLTIYDLAIAGLTSWLQARVPWWFTR